MSLPPAVQTGVSQSAITKVTRLFNGTATDVLTELLQNSRRAGATGIETYTFDVAGVPYLIVRDDGGGVSNPQAIVTLGESGWDNDLARREDPAGMGFFSLAGRSVEVRAYSAALGSGWRLAITPEAWESRAPIAVEPCDIGLGTEIIVRVPPEWQPELSATIAKVAAYYPLPVSFNGVEQRRSDWLAEAVRVEPWNGRRIGVVKDRPRYASPERLNFHGLTVACELPEVPEVEQSHLWRAYVDIGDTPELQLVLPARKEVVQNAAFTALQVACKAAIFRAIAQQPSIASRLRPGARRRTSGSSCPTRRRTSSPGPRPPTIAVMPVFSASGSRTSP